MEVKMLGIVVAIALLLGLIIGIIIAGKEDIDG